MAKVNEKKLSEKLTDGGKYSVLAAALAGVTSLAITHRFNLSPEEMTFLTLQLTVIYDGLLVYINHKLKIF